MSESDADLRAEREALASLCLSYLRPPKYAGGSWTLNPHDLADAIIAAGWTARDAALAGERAAREALARVEALAERAAPFYDDDGSLAWVIPADELSAALSPVRHAPDCGLRYGDDCTCAALSPTPPDATEWCRHDSRWLASACQVCGQPTPPDTAEQEPQR